ncbi:MAG: RnfABCDGE type electron transport complex subunit G [Erysipelotrichia bacterium]|nr:RnfABCDGE type electron transport complex subunit G [Erysipelotrichia bacterium]
MKDMMHMGLFLFIIAAVSGILLAYTENLTAPLIKENQRQLLEQARREVLPEAKSFSDKILENETDKIPVTAGFTSSNELAGIVMNVSPKGYGGPIEMVVGITPAGRISGVKILSQKETPGLGTKLSAPVFTEPFKKLLTEKSAPDFRVKKDGGDIDAITAATISSRAFCSGLKDALANYEKIKAGLSSLEPLSQKAQPASGEAK